MHGDRITAKTDFTWRGRLALVALFCFPLAFYLPLFARGGNTVILEDGLLYSFPLRVFIHNAFTHGFSPQWMPYAAGGFSLLAEGQSSLCFPATQILYRVFPAEIGWMIESVLGLLTAFAGCCFFLRRLSVGLFAGLFGASVYAFSLQAISGQIVPSMMWTYAMFPLLLVAFFDLVQNRQGAFLECVILTSLLLLTGHPVMILYAGMITSLFVFFTVAVSCRDCRFLSRLLLKLTGCMILAVLIALPQLLPMMELFPISARTATPLSLEELQNTLHMHPHWIPQAFFPLPFDLTRPEFLSALIRYPLYAVCLAAAGLFAKARPAKWFFAGLGVFLLLLALGPYVGLWKWVHSLPVLRHFRFPFRWLFFLPICVSVLSAFGLDQICRYKTFAVNRNHLWVLRSMLTVFLLGLFMLIFRKWPVYMSYAENAFSVQPVLSVLLCFSALAMIPAILLLTGSVVNKKVIGAGVFLTLISLFAVCSFFTSDPNITTRLDKIGWPWQLRMEPQQYRVSAAHVPYSIWHSKLINDYYAYTPNLSLLNNRRHTGHYCSFIPYWASDMSAWCQKAVDGQQEWVNMLNVCSARGLAAKDMSRPVQVPLRKEVYEIKLLENSDAVPRANVISSYVFRATEADLIEYMKSADFNAKTTAVLLNEDAGKLAPASARALCDSAATITVDRPDCIEIEITSAHADGSLLVLGDTFYPGWKAYVDGKETPILRANYAFRGVSLSADARKVVFKFQPVVPEWALSMPSIVLVILGILWLRTKRAAAKQTALL